MVAMVTIDEALANAKSRYVEAANKGTPETIMSEVSDLMSGHIGLGYCRLETPLLQVLTVYGLNEAAKVARQHGNIRHADRYHEYAQVILQLLAEDVGHLIGAVAHFGGMKH